MKKISYYISPGFSLEGNRLTFATPSVSFGSCSVQLPQGSLATFIKQLNDKKFSTLTETTNAWWDPDGIGGSPYVMHWEISERTWEDHVFLQEPLASALLRLLKSRME